MDSAVSDAVVSLIGESLGAARSFDGAETGLGVHVSADGRGASVFVPTAWGRPLLQAFAESGALAVAFGGAAADGRAVGFGETFVVTLTPLPLPGLVALTITATGACGQIPGDSSAAVPHLGRVGPE